MNDTWPTQELLEAARDQANAHDQNLRDDTLIAVVNAYAQHCAMTRDQPLEFTRGNLTGLDARLAVEYALHVTAGTITPDDLPQLFASHTEVGASDPDIDFTSAWGSWAAPPVGTSPHETPGQTHERSIRRIITPQVAAVLANTALTLHDTATMEVEYLDGGPVHGADDPVSFVFSAYPPLTFHQGSAWRVRAAQAFGVLHDDFIAGRIPFPRTPAEEMAMHLILDRYAHYEPVHYDIPFSDDLLYDDVQEAVIELRERLFHDHDILMLFDMPDIANPNDPTNHAHAIGNYTPANWFTPFDAPPTDEQWQPRTPSDNQQRLARLYEKTLREYDMSFPEGDGLRVIQTYELTNDDDVINRARSVVLSRGAEKPGTDVFTDADTALLDVGVLMQILWTVSEAGHLPLGHDPVVTHTRRSALAVISTVTALVSANDGLNDGNNVCEVSCAVLNRAASVVETVASLLEKGVGIDADLEQDRSAFIHKLRDEAAKMREIATTN